MTEVQPVRICHVTRLLLVQNPPNRDFDCRHSPRSQPECSGYCWSVFKTVEIEIDDDLVQEVIRRYGVYDRREAVHLALRALLGETQDGELDHHEEEYDEFSDPKAWQPHRSTDTG